MLCIVSFYGSPLQVDSKTSCFVPVHRHNSLLVLKLPASPLDRIICGATFTNIMIMKKMLRVGDRGTNKIAQTIDQKWGELQTYGWLYQVVNSRRQPQVPSTALGASSRLVASVLARDDNANSEKRRAKRGLLV